jgi:type II secretory pathway pseudopilin PulG
MTLSPGEPLQQALFEEETMLRSCLSAFVLTVGLGVQTLAQAPAPAAKPQTTKPSITTVSASGFTLVELLFALGLAAVLCGLAVPSILRTIDRSRALAAVRYLASRMTLARMQAATWGAAVALRFEQTGDGLVFSIYRDGNRNGVLTADIERGVDRQIDLPVRLSQQFPGVDIGLAPAAAVRDPLHIGRTAIVTFSPLGTATSGTIYVVGADGTQWGVRVLGATGRTRVLRHVPEDDQWMPAF